MTFSVTDRVNWWTESVFSRRYTPTYFKAKIYIMYQEIGFRILIKIVNRRHVLHKCEFGKHGMGHKQNQYTGYSTVVKSMQVAVISSFCEKMLKHTSTNRRKKCLLFKPFPISISLFIKYMFAFNGHEFKFVCCIHTSSTWKNRYDIQVFVAFWPSF